MASGENHDKLIVISTPIAALACAAAGAIDQLPLFTLAYVFGGLWLSPDLDLPSRPYKRWGLLKFFWLPYQKTMKHRGQSHWVIVGTLGRVAYLSIPILLYFLLTGTPPGLILELAARYARPIVFCLIAIEFSALVHLIADGLILGERR